MLRKRFQLSLDKLNEDMIDMATQTEKAIDSALTALETHDTKLAQKVIDGDKAINEMEIKIHQDCVDIITTQQPVAGDVRAVTSVLKMCTDVERIADHAADISQLVIELQDKNDHAIDLAPFRKMEQIVEKMLQTAIGAFIDQNMVVAEEVWRRDEKVNKLYAKILNELAKTMKKHPESIPSCINYIQIAKYLERIGDHTKNLAEYVIYNVTGEMLFDAERFEEAIGKLNDE